MESYFLIQNLASSTDSLELIQVSHGGTKARSSIPVPGSGRVSLSQATPVPLRLCARLMAAEECISLWERRSTPAQTSERSVELLYHSSSTDSFELTQVSHLVGQRHLASWVATVARRWTHSLTLSTAWQRMATKSSRRQIAQTAKQLCPNRHKGTELNSST